MRLYINKHLQELYLELCVHISQNISRDAHNVFVKDVYAYSNAFVCQYMEIVTYVSRYFRRCWGTKPFRIFNCTAHDHIYTRLDKS